MAINNDILLNADDYFKYHKLKELWLNIVFSDFDNEDVLIQADNLIKNTFNLRENAENEISYHHAVYEQAIHMLSFDKERYLLQNQGVKLYSYDGMQFQQGQSFISPIAHMFLKKLIYRKVGDIR